jgi:ribonucleoside-diphosphate reductase alpha chain
MPVMMIEKRNGEVVKYSESKIETAISKAAMAAGKSQLYIEEKINGLVGHITVEMKSRFSNSGFTPNVENVHDIVEKHLMQANHYDVAKSYILYRAERRRQDTEDRKKVGFLRKLKVEKRDGHNVLFNPKKIKETIERCSKGLKKINIDDVFSETVKNVYDGIKSEEIEKTLILTATSMIEIEPDYNQLASRLFVQKSRKEVFSTSTEYGTEDAEEAYRESFIHSIQFCVEKDILDKRMLDFDLNLLSEKIVIKRDEKIFYMGHQTLYERYFIKDGERRLELPQIFWMRVAMGLSLNEENKEKKAIEFYNVMSQLKYIPSTPTLFHAGTTHPQLSSCYLTSIDDDLKDIFKSFADNSQLSKWSGGIGNDWTNVRSIGSAIKSTKVESQGTIPFLKIANDTTVAINRSGKRRGATVAYLETWHLDIEDFLDLRKNTGDDRRRTHDMNTANWIPDLFMKRVQEGGKWSLFSPDEVPDLHELYGNDFEKAYLSYERKGKRGKLNKYKSIEAKKLWKKMITMLFETGHPWFCFKDVCNIRSPQDHVGVVHSSNLCTEITLNTKPSKLIEEVEEDGVLTKKYELGEVAVCNLGSLCLPNLMKNKKIDYKLLKKTIQTAMRMLDNVIDLNFYPIPEAKHANMQHRPVGLGIMGLQDALFLADINYEDSEDFVDELQENISYEAISASSDLAKERGSYETMPGSKWDRGIFPLDTLDLLEEERGMKIDVPRTFRCDWKELKKKVKENGMRNSNTMAIAPTATISTIAGCIGACTEPVYKNIFVKSNMSGEFTITNWYLIEDLKKLKLWNKDMLDQLKFNDGKIQQIESIPAEIKAKYKESFEIDPKKAIDLAALRGKWIDQSQSHNVFIAGQSGKLLSEVYMYAWGKGLKTTYYLRSLGKSQIEKATLDAGKYGFTQKRNDGTNNDTVKLCKIEDPDCEACQ